MPHEFLTGTSLALRAIEAADVNDRYQQWFNDPEVCRFNSHHRFPMDPETMQAYYHDTIQSRNNLILAIIDRATDVHIGNIALQDIDQIQRSAEFAILIGDRAFWGKGVGTEAGRLIIGHGFRSLNLHRIFCGTSRENTAMQKLATALGFIQEGVSREALFKDGAYHDAIQYGLLAHEYSF